MWLLVALLLSTPASANAPPPDLIEVEQPDGTKLRARFRAHGRGVVAEDEEGWPIVGESPAEGPAGTEWTWAREEGGRLRSTGVRPGRGDPRALGLQKRRELRLERTGEAATVDEEPRDDAPSRAPGPASVAAPGSMSSLEPLVLLVRFPGELPGGMPRARYTKDQFAALFFERGLRPGASGLPSSYPMSLRDYFAEVSDGRFDLRGHVVDWITLPRRYAYYADDQQGLGSFPKNARGLVADAVAAADARVDFSRYDADGDGAVDALIVVVEGWMNGSGAQLWPHYWNLEDVRADGVAVNRYVLVAEQFAIDNQRYRQWGIERGAIHPIGIAGHELGHMLGLPDLYDTSYEVAGIDDWGLMGHGPWRAPHSPAWPGAWSRVRLGWTHVIDVPPGGLDARLAPVTDGGAVYRAWIDPYRQFEYFLLENRQQAGSDRHLPGGGLLIWHVDERIIDRYPADNDVNAGALHGVHVEQADGHGELESERASADAGDPWPGASGRRAFTPSTTPNTGANDGTDSGVAITGIQTSGAVVAARVEVPGSFGYTLAYDTFTAGAARCAIASGRCGRYSEGAVRFTIPVDGHAGAVRFWTRGRVGESTQLRVYGVGGDGGPGEVWWSTSYTIDDDGWADVYIDAELPLEAGDDVFVSVAGSGEALFTDDLGRGDGRSFTSADAGPWRAMRSDLNIRLVVETDGSGPLDRLASHGSEPKGGCRSAPIGGGGLGLLAAAAALGLRRRRI